MYAMADEVGEKNQGGVPEKSEGWMLGVRAECVRMMASPGCFKKSPARPTPRSLARSPATSA